MSGRVFTSLLLREIPDGKVLVAHHQTDLTLARLPAQLPAEIAERGEVAAIFDIHWRCVAVHDNWLILHNASSGWLVPCRCPEPAVRSNRQYCYGLRSHATPRGSRPMSRDRPV